MTASLLVKALGADKVWSIFVDTGMMRHKEAEEVLDAYAKMGLKVKAVFAEEEKLFDNLTNNRKITKHEINKLIISSIIDERVDNQQCTL